VLLNLSFTHLKLGEPQPALQAAAAALSLDPQSAKVPLRGGQSQCRRSCPV
jgi:hypothetical protein